MTCGDSPPVAYSEGSYAVFDEASAIGILALQYHMDWELDSPSELATARVFLETINTRQKKLLHTDVSKFLKANPNDSDLMESWLKMGAYGWLKKTDLRCFLEELLSELKKTA